MLGSELTVLDRELRLGEHLWIDLLCVEEGGRAVVVLVGDGDLPAELGRVAAAFSALQAGSWLLDRLFADQGLDAFAPPGFVLLARRFAAPVEPLLALVSGLDLRLYEYATASDGEGPDRLVVCQLGSSGERLAAPASNGSHGPSPSAKSSTAPEVAPEPEPELALLDRLEVSAACRRLSLRARDSIRSLSSGIAMTCEGDGLTFRIEGVVLATLHPQREWLRIRLGEGGASSDLEVRDDEGIHAGLNAVFGDFFRRFATAD